jgi:hypothetical protein
MRKAYDKIDFGKFNAHLDQYSLKGKYIYVRCSSLCTCVSTHLTVSHYIKLSSLKYVCINTETFLFPREYLMLTKRRA